MKNKSIEESLIKNSMTDFVKIVERCEEGRIEEIQIKKKSGITGVEDIDQEIYAYLETLKVKVIFTENMQPVKKFKEKKKKSCSVSIHKIHKSKKSKEGKVKELKKEAYKMFKIDENTFAACPDCFKIFHIL